MSEAHVLAAAHRVVDRVLYAVRIAGAADIDVDVLAFELLERLPDYWLADDADRAEQRATMRAIVRACAACPMCTASEIIAAGSDFALAPQHWARYPIDYDGGAHVWRGVERIDPARRRQILVFLETEMEP